MAAQRAAVEFLQRRAAVITAQVPLRIPLGVSWCVRVPRAARVRWIVHVTWFRSGRARVAWFLVLLLRREQLEGVLVVMTVPQLLLVVVVGAVLWRRFGQRSQPTGDRCGMRALMQHGVERGCNLASRFSNRNWCAWGA